MFLSLLAIQHLGGTHYLDHIPRHAVDVDPSNSAPLWARRAQELLQRIIVDAFFQGNLDKKFKPEISN